VSSGSSKENEIIVGPGTWFSLGVGDDSAVGVGWEVGVGMGVGVKRALPQPGRLVVIRQIISPIHPSRVDRRSEFTSLMSPSPFHFGNTIRIKGFIYHTQTHAYLITFL
jgi:hypothetical protein